MTLRSFGSAAFVISASAQASLTGLAANSSFVGANGEYCQLDLYATFDAPGYWLNFMCCGPVTPSGATFADFIQNDSFGGSWAPQVTHAGAIDSFVTIGGATGPSNSAGADPVWGAAGFNQVAIPAGAGWFNMNPTNFQGLGQVVSLVDSNGAPTYSGYAALAARFVLPTNLAYGASLSFSGIGGWGYALDITGYVPISGSFSFATVPAPASLLLFVPIGARFRGGRFRR